MYTPYECKHTANYKGCSVYLNSRNDNGYKPQKPTAKLQNRRTNYTETDFQITVTESSEIGQKITTETYAYGITRSSSNNY